VLTVRVLVTITVSDRCRLVGDPVATLVATRRAHSEADDEAAEEEEDGSGQCQPDGYTKGSGRVVLEVVDAVTDDAHDDKVEDESDERGDEGQESNDGSEEESETVREQGDDEGDERENCEVSTGSTWVLKGALTGCDGVKDESLGYIGNGTVVVLDTGEGANGTSDIVSETRVGALIRLRSSAPQKFPPKQLTLPKRQ
jgi:hypothetical protein